MINDYHMLSGIQKVAILFSVVGESLAMSLIKGLSKLRFAKYDPLYDQWALFHLTLKSE